MEISRRPRIIIWIVSDDGRYIVNAIKILERQHNGIEILGVTATQKISINNWEFLPLNEISLNRGGV